MGTRISAEEFTFSHKAGMECSKCRGSMFLEDMGDLKEGCQMMITAWKCVQCGNALDPLIAYHKKLTPEEAQALYKKKYFPRKRKDVYTQTKRS